MSRALFVFGPSGLWPRGPLAGGGRRPAGGAPHLRAAAGGAAGGRTRAGRVDHSQLQPPIVWKNEDSLIQ